jgi:hypothetical protein
MNSIANAHLPALAHAGAHASMHAHALALTLPALATDWAPPTLRGVAIAMLCVLVCCLIIKRRRVP